MKANVILVTVIVVLTMSLYSNSYSAEKVVVIPLMGKASNNNTVTVSTVSKFLSIPGAAFVPQAPFDPIITQQGAIYHDANGVSRSFVAPIVFPSGAKSYDRISAAICYSTPINVQIFLRERSMADGSLTLNEGVTLDNTNGNSDCHVLYGSPADGTIQGVPYYNKYDIDHETKTYFVEVSGMLGDGVGGTELDYIRIRYQIDEITVQ